MKNTWQRYIHLLYYTKSLYIYCYYLTILTVCDRRMVKCKRGYSNEILRILYEIMQKIALGV